MWRLYTFVLFKARKIFKIHILYYFTLGEITRPICLSPNDYRSYLISRRRQDHKLVFLTQLCQENNIITLIDIGANYGEFSVLLSELVEQVISVEPNPFILPYLRHTISLSLGSETLFKIIDRACVSSDNKLSYPSYLPFLVDSSYSGGGHLMEQKIENKIIRNSKTSFLLFGKKERVEVRTISVQELLDSIYVEGRKTSFLMKIDVEGHEYHILRGIKNWLIKRSSIEIELGILFEYNQNSFNNSTPILSLINDFLDLEFSVYSIPGSPELHKLIGIKKITFCSDFNPDLDQEIFLAKHLTTSFLTLEDVLKEVGA